MAATIAEVLGVLKVLRVLRVLQVQGSSGSGFFRFGVLQVRGSSVRGSRVRGSSVRGSSVRGSSVRGSRVRVFFRATTLIRSGGAPCVARRTDGPQVTQGIPASCGWLRGFA